MPKHEVPRAVERCKLSELCPCCPWPRRWAGSRRGRSSPSRRATYTFGSTAAPGLSNPSQMATTFVDSTVTVSPGRGRRQGDTYRLGYQTFF